MFRKRMYFALKAGYNVASLLLYFFPILKYTLKSFITVNWNDIKHLKYF